MDKSLHYELFRPIAVPVIYIQLLRGDAEAAILLSQLLYWSDKTRNPDGWIYKTYEDWYGEIGFSKAKTHRAAGALQKMGFVEVVLKRANCAPTLHYRVNLPAFTAALEAFAVERVKSLSIARNPDNAEIIQSNSMIFEEFIPEQTLTETTLTEITLNNCDESFIDEYPGDSQESLPPSQDTPIDLPVEGPPIAISREPSQDIPASLESALELPVSTPIPADMITGMELPASRVDVRPPLDDSDPIEVKRWFDETWEVEKRSRNVIRRTVPEIRQGVEDAVIRGINNTSGEISEFVKAGISESNARSIMNFLASIPDDVRPIAKEFCRQFGRAPLSSEKKGWIAELKAQYELGIQAGDIVEAFRDLGKSEMTIKAPISVRATAEKYKKMRNANGLLPGEKKHTRRVLASAGAQKYLPNMENGGEK